MKFRLGAILLMTGFSASALTAEDTPKSALLVLDKGENALAIVDPATLKVVAKVPAGQDPHEVVASADGKLAFVSNYGGGHTLSVIDLVARRRGVERDSRFGRRWTRGL
jgi:YVTN family beta-propeller protein